MEERHLIEACVRGESWAQKNMYELYAPAMMSVCQRYAGNRDTARDLLHDGFIRLFAKIHTYSGAGSFNRWMKKVFVTSALEHFRQKDVMRNSVNVEDIDFQTEDADVSLFEHLTLDDLMACVTNLPDEYRTVFNMHAIEGYTHVEISRELEIHEGTSRSRYARARQMLQKMVMNKVDRMQIVVGY